MWVWADGGIVNCNQFKKLWVTIRQDGVYLVMGQTHHDHIVLSEHNAEAEAQASLRALFNRMNRTK